MTENELVARIEELQKQNDELRESLRKTEEQRINYSRLPEHMREGARRYVENRQSPGRFLRAVLENNLRDAFYHADTLNEARMFVWARFLSQLPPSAYGSRKRVDAWVAEKSGA